MPAGRITLLWWTCESTMNQAEPTIYAGSYSAPWAHGTISGHSDWIKQLEESTSVPDVMKETLGQICWTRKFEMENTARTKMLPVILK